MFGLSFLSPLYLAGAIAVAVPILLHLFRRKADLVVDFPAVRLIVKAPVEQHRRRRLREWILLALRVAALILLAGSFGRPYFAGTGIAATTPLTVVAIDTSMSLSAPGQFAQAQQFARDAVRQAPAFDAVAVIAFADSATVVVPMTTDRAAAAAAIAALRAGASGTHYRTALARAAEVIGDRHARLVIVTDLQQGGWDAGDEGGLPDGVDVDLRVVPPPGGNVAVTSADRKGAAIVAAVHNFGGAPVQAPVALTIDGRLAAQTSVTVPPQASATVSFPPPIPATGAAEVTVTDEIGYAADNVRYLSLDPPSASPVTVVVADSGAGSPGLFIERALSLADEGRAFAVRVVDGHALASWPTETMTANAAVVVLGTRTLDRTGRSQLSSYLQGGGQVWLTLGPDVDPATLHDVIGVTLAVAPDPVQAVAGAATLVANDSRHPIFRPFLNPAGALGDVAIERYRILGPQSGLTVLAQLSGGATALAEMPAGKGRLLVFTSDLDNQWSRFPLNPAFVPFTIETMRYLTASRRVRTTWVLPEVPPGRPDQPGVFSVGDGADAHRVAVNVDVRESNPAATSADEFIGGIARLAANAARESAGEARAVEDQQRLWQVGLALMLAALAGEGFVGRRTN